MNPSMFLNLFRMDSYTPGDRVPASQKYTCSTCGHIHVFVKGERFPACETCKEYRWVPKGTLFHFVSKNLNKEFERISSLQLKFADYVTGFVGNMTFLYVHALWFFFWIGINLEWFYRRHVFDPYPFGLLTMIVSLEAIFLTTLVMVSQNVQAQRSELRAELDYQVNLKAEKEIATIHEELQRNNAMTKEALEMMGEIHKRRR